MHQASWVQVSFKFACGPRSVVDCSPTLHILIDYVPTALLERVVNKAMDASLMEPQRSTALW